MILAYRHHSQATVHRTRKTVIVICLRKSVSPLLGHLCHLWSATTVIAWHHAASQAKNPAVTTQCLLAGDQTKNSDSDNIFVFTFAYALGWLWLICWKNTPAHPLCVTYSRNIIQIHLIHVSYNFVIASESDPIIVIYLVSGTFYSRRRQSHIVA